MTKRAYIIVIILTCFITLYLRYGLGPTGEYFRSNNNVNIAKYLWEVGDFLGDESSTQHLGFLYWSRYIERDPDKALKLLESISEYPNRYMTRLLVLGSIYEYKGNKDQAIKNYTLVCQLRISSNYPNGCALLSYALFDDKNYEESYRYAALLEEEKFHNIYFLLSVMHLNGLGVEKKNFEKAVNYMNLCIKNCTFMKNHAKKALNMIEGESKEFSNVHDYDYWKDYFIEYE